MKFKVIYSDGTVRYEEASDCVTVDQFVNTRFGTSSGLDKITVTFAEEPAPTAPAPKRVK